MNLKIKYSLDFEIKRIEDTISKFDWYQKQGYGNQIDFPEKIQQVDIKTLTKEKIRSFTEEEYKYNSENYQQIAFKINTDWENFLKDHLELFNKSGLKTEKEYVVHLTRYGVGGSYNYPNTIIINFRKKEPSRFIQTIIHEIIHLSIQPYVEKYAVPHWKKERLVDLTFKKILPEMAIEQKIKERFEDVEIAFKKYFPEFGKIAALVGDKE